MKKCKNISTKNENVSDATCKAWPFSSDCKFARTDGPVTADITVHWLQALPLPVVGKSSIVNVIEFLELSFKNLAMHKTRLVLCESQSCFLLFWNVATFIESHCIFLCYFFQYDEVFLISVLDGYYHYLFFMDPVNGCSKSKLLVK